MAGGIVTAIKNTILILEEVNRLKGNISKVLERVDTLENRLNDVNTKMAVTEARGEALNEKVDRIEGLERRLNDIDKNKEISKVKDEVLIAKFEAAMKSAVAENNARLVERIVRLEMSRGVEVGEATKRISSNGKEE